MKTRNLISRAALKVGLSNDPISKKARTICARLTNGHLKEINA